MMLESDWHVVIDTVIVTQGKRYNTLQIQTHPKFSSDTNDYDLGLLRTETEMRMGGGLLIWAGKNPKVKYFNLKKTKDVGCLASPE